ncbi:MAG: SRPBCC domain-containing protein, partial [Fulvivirga sp.]
FHIKMTDADEDWNPTSFGFDLTELEGGVDVKFWHVGWPECNHHFRRSSYCWAILLQGLKNYIEKGIIIPFEERE